MIKNQTLKDKIAAIETSLDELAIELADISELPDLNNSDGDMVQQASKSAMTARMCLRRALFG